MRVSSGLLTSSPTTGRYRIWRRLVVAHAVQGRQVHDARLVALLPAHGITHILTLNAATSPGIPASSYSTRRVWRFCLPLRRRPLEPHHCRRYRGGNRLRQAGIPDRATGSGHAAHRRPNGSRSARSGNGGSSNGFGFWNGAAAGHGASGSYQYHSRPLARRAPGATPPAAPPSPASASSPECPPRPPPRTTPPPSAGHSPAPAAASPSPGPAAAAPPPACPTARPPSGPPARSTPPPAGPAPTATR